jgi:hypothetical protein
MTAAGLASLYAAIDGMSASPDAAKRSAASCIPIKRGLAWMDKRFPRDKNKTLQMPYFLYVLSRVGLASGRQMFGTTDWGAWGTQWLLEHQRKPHINKTCPTCGRTYDPSATQCWQCKQELPEPPIPPDAAINWNDNSWDTALSILFLVNAERAKNP